MKFILALSIIILCCGTATGETVSVAADSANIRSFPSLSGSMIVLQVPRYYPLTVLEGNNQFFRVADYRNKEGWIYKPLVSKASAVVVQRGPANIRSGPGTDNRVLFKAEKGVSFMVLEYQEDWIKIHHQSGNVGWISKNLTWGGN